MHKQKRRHTIATMKTRAQTMEKWKKDFSGKLLIFFFISLVMMLPALMAFDAPRSEGSIVTKIFSYSIMLYPITFGISAGLAWLLYTIKQHKLACIISKLPIINIVVVLIGLGLLIFVCKGKFVCPL